MSQDGLPPYAPPVPGGPAVQNPQRTRFASHSWVEFDDAAGAPTTTVVDITKAKRNIAGGQDLETGHHTRAQFLGNVRDPNPPSLTVPTVIFTTGPAEYVL